MNSIQTASPVEIDTEIFALLQRLWDAQERLAQLDDSAHRVAGDRKHGSYGRGWWGMTDAEAWEKVRGISTRTGVDYTVREALDLNRDRDGYSQQVQDLRDEIKPLDVEFYRRGGWTRAYLVDNADGHVHNTDRCSSFRIGTRYHWLTERSGQDEAQIVADAGERACTICYSSAPVDTFKRPSKIEGPAQAAAREAKAQRDAEKAVRDAKKAAKAIANPDGSPLRGKWGQIATEVSAWRELVDDIFTTRAYGYSRSDQANERIIAALIVKTGQTREQILATVESKVVAKAKREKVTL